MFMKEQIYVRFNDGELCWQMTESRINAAAKYSTFFP